MGTAIAVICIVVLWVALALSGSKNPTDDMIAMLIGLAVVGAIIYWAWGALFGG